MSLQKTHTFIFWISSIMGAVSALWAQEETTDVIPAFADISRTYPAIQLEDDVSTTLELMIMRWGESESTSQAFSLSITERPTFIQTAALSESRIQFGSEDWEIPITITLSSQDTDEAGEGDLKLLITAEDPTIQPQLRELVIPLKSSAATTEESDELTGNFEFVVRTWREDYNPRNKDRKDHILELLEEDIPLYTVDPVFICFTATADDVNFGFYRILDPNGEVNQIGGKGGSTSNQLNDNNALNQVEDAPYDIIIDLKPKDRAEEGDWSQSRVHLPGEYTLQVAKSIYTYEGTSIYGIPTGSKPGEWQTVGTFEINEPIFNFQGTVSRVYPNTDNIDKYRQYIEVSPETGGSSGSLNIKFGWSDPDNGERDLAETRFFYKHPEQLPYSNLDDLPNSIYKVEPREGDNFTASYLPYSGLQMTNQRGAFIKIDETDVTRAAVSIPSVSLGRSTNVEDASGIRIGIDHRFYMDDTVGVSSYIPLTHADKSFGWHLRDTEMHYGIAHQLEVNGPTNLGRIYVVGVYALETGTITQAELTELGLKMERPDLDEKDDEEQEDESDEDENEDSDTSSASGGGSIGGTSTTPTAGGGPGSQDSSSDDILNEPSSRNPARDRDRSRTPATNEDPSANDPYDPSAIDPNDPSVSVYIQMWIQIAEPPENATEGASFKYNEWGVLTGSTRTGTSTTQSKPDEAAGQNSSEYLWTQRTRLDSVDHCTLEEYVLAMINGESIQNCRGRYKTAGNLRAPNVTGMRMEAAERIINNMGLTPEWVAGPQAPAPHLTGMIASQNPANNTPIQKGQTIQLEIYMEPLNELALPDLTGLTIDEAEAQLESMGLLLELEVGEPASQKTEEFTVQSHSPGANAQVMEGDTVSLQVYSQFIDTLTVPDVRGQSLEDAIITMKNAGLTTKIAFGNPAPNTFFEGRVEDQLPAGGQTVISGDPVQLTLFADVGASPVNNGGNRNTPSGSSGSLSTSRINQIQLPAEVGQYGKTPLYKDFSNIIRKGNDEWKHPEMNVRYAKFDYAKDKHYKDQPALRFGGYHEMELFWLEANDSIDANAQKLFSTLTHTGGDNLRPEMAPEGTFLHSPELMAVLKVTSSNYIVKEIGGIGYLEEWVKPIMNQLSGVAMKRDNEYRPITAFRVPTSILDLRASDSTINRKSRSEVGGWIPSTGIKNTKGGDSYFGFKRGITLYYNNSHTDPYRNLNRNLTLDESLDRSAKSNSTTIYLYWMEWGDPFNADAHQVFSETRPFTNLESGVNNSSRSFITHSNRIAACAVVHIRIGKANPRNYDQRIAATQQTINDLFRQLEGHALKKEDIPTSPQMK